MGKTGMRLGARPTPWMFVAGLAAAMIASSAHAADAITLALGGRIKQFFFVASQSQAAAEDLNSTGMFNDTRLSAEGRTILDNGITVRAFVRLKAVARETSNLDEAYVDVISGIGRLRLGEKAGVNATTIGDPVPQAFLTVDEEIIGDAMLPRTGITLRHAFTFERFTGNALGVSYQTPDVFGLRLGVAYHPTPTAAIGTVNGGISPHDALDVTAAYDGDFSGGTYRLAAGYFRLSSRTGGHDGAEAWNVSLGATYGGFELAGAYLSSQPASSLDEEAWTIGALYGVGPISVSADYRSARRRPLPLALVKDHIDRATLQTAYKLGPGISVGLAGFYADQKDAAGLAWDGGGVLGGIKIDF